MKCDGEGEIWKVWKMMRKTSKIEQSSGNSDDYKILIAW